MLFLLFVFVHVTNWRFCKIKANMDKKKGYIWKLLSCYHESVTCKLTHLFCMIYKCSDLCCSPHSFNIAVTLLVEKPSRELFLLIWSETSMMQWTSWLQTDTIRCEAAVSHQPQDTFGSLHQSCDTKDIHSLIGLPTWWSLPPGQWPAWWSSAGGSWATWGNNKT